MQGEVDAATAPRMGETVNRLLGTQASAWCSTCATSTSWTCTASRVMIRATRRARSDGGSFAIARPAPCVRRLVELVHAENEVQDPARRHRSRSTPPRRRYLLHVRSLTDTWTLGDLRLANRVVLAPLAGIGNWFVRLQAKRHGAGLVVSEMVSSFGLVHGDARTHREFLRIHPDEHPVSMQLFGHDPAVMREAAAIAAAAGADLIDLNMGCPVRKVCKTGAGAALLDDPDRAVAIARAAREGSGLPGDRQAAPGPRARRPRRRRARAPAGGGGGRGRHRLPPAPRLAAAHGRARLRARARAGRGAARAGDPLRRPLERGAGRAAHSRRAAPPPSCSRAGRSAIRGCSAACWAPTRPSPPPEEVLAELEWVISSRRGPPRRGTRRPLFAQVLSLVRRAPRAHQA